MRIINNKALLLFILLVVTTVIYWPGLSGGFYFDDQWNIVQNSALEIDDLSFSSLASAADSGRAGPLGRPFATATFAVNYYFSGFNPFFFKITNLVIHLLSGIGVYFLSSGLARQIAFLDKRQYGQFGLLVSAFWLLHPLNLTPVLYAVQRMTSLSALFCFWGLACYVFGRLRLNDGRASGFLLILAGFFIFLPLGVISKENAALFPLFCFLIEIIFFQLKSKDLRARTLLVALFVTTLALPLSVIAVHTLTNPGWILKGYAVREFGLMERLLTESRIVVFYLKQVVLPVNSELGLFHDDIGLSRSLVSPFTTMLSILLISALLSTAVFLRKRFPIFSFGVLLFFAAHLMESTVIGLELVHEHRNYFASFSIIFLVAYLFLIPIKNESLMKVKYGLLLVTIFYLGFSTFIRSSIWGNPNLHAFEELRNHPESPRVNYQVGRIFATHGYQQDDPKRKNVYLDKASRHFSESADLSKSYTDGLFGLMMLQGIEGLKTDEHYKNMLLDRLANGPFHANNYNYLVAFFKCIKSADCKVSPNEVDGIMQACKENKSFKGRHAKNILIQYADYRAKLVL